MRKITFWTDRLHRYFGISLAIPMLAWCLSGVVMMYVGYPSLPEEIRLGHLSSLSWAGCCVIGEPSLSDDTPVRQIQVEMLAGHPVLRISPVSGPSRLIDITDGHLVDGIGSGWARDVAAAYGPVAEIWSLTDDQWTVADDFASDRPLFHVILSGQEGAELYVSSSNGKAVQFTTRWQRFWNWLGAIPHWVYFTSIRRNVSLWAEIVIWTSLAGGFLTAIGIYIGIRQFRRRPPGRWSAHRGVMLWHHVPGLIFGLFTFTWVMSGFLSMNPWGTLEGVSADPARARVQGRVLTGGEVKRAVRDLAGVHLDPDVVSIASAPLDGSFYLIATSRDGRRWRLDATGQPASPPDIARIATLLGTSNGGNGLELIDREDAYYFGHHGELAPLPVYRLILDDRGIRYYIDPLSGDIVRKVDANGRWYRWLEQAPHRLDFATGLRARPTWDLVALLLLGGVALSCGTGCYLSVRWVWRKVVKMSGRR